MSFKDIIEAAQTGKSDIVVKALESKILRLNQALPPNNMTILHYAAKSQKSLDLLKTLLKYKELEINPKDKAGFTPLMVAMLNENLPSIKALLEYGADSSLKRKGQTLLEIMEKDFGEKFASEAKEIIKKAEIWKWFQSILSTQDTIFARITSQLSIEAVSKEEIDTLQQLKEAITNGNEFNFTTCPSVAVWEFIATLISQKTYIETIKISGNFNQDFLSELETTFAEFQGKLDMSGIYAAYRENLSIENSDTTHLYRLRLLTHYEKLINASLQAQKFNKDKVLKTIELASSSANKVLVVPSPLTDQQTLALINLNSLRNMFAKACADAKEVENFSLDKFLERESLFKIAEVFVDPLLTILKSKDVIQKFDANLICHIARTHPAAAQAILNSDILVKKLMPVDIWEMGINNSQAACFILASEKLSSQLAPNELIVFAKEHEDALLLILQSPQSQLTKLAKAISSSALVEAAKRYEKVAMTILSSEDLVFQLGNSNILLIAKAHAQAAMFVLQSDKLASQLSRDYIREIACRHAQAAIFVLQSEKLVSQLSRDYIREIACRHAQAATFVLQSEKLASQLDRDDIHYIVNAHAQAAMVVLQSEKLASRLGRYAIPYIASTHAQAAMVVLQSEKLASQLDRYAIPYIASAHAQAAMFVLQSEKLANQLDRYTVLSIAIAHVQAAMFTLRSEKLAKSLNKLDLRYIGMMHTTAALYILQSHHLLEKLDGNDLFAMGISYKTTAQFILDSQTLLKKISPEHKSQLEYIAISKDEIVSPTILEKYVSPAIKQEKISAFFEPTKLHAIKEVSSNKEEVSFQEKPNNSSNVKFFSPNPSHMDKDSDDESTSLLDKSSDKSVSSKYKMI